RGLDPPLSESEITRERLALEESIRKVEAEAARKAHFEMPRINPVTVTRPLDLLKRDEKPVPPLVPQPASAPAREAAPAPAREPGGRDGAAAKRETSAPARAPAEVLGELLGRAREDAPPKRDAPSAKREPVERPVNDQPPRRGFLPDAPPPVTEPRRPESPPASATAATAPAPGRSRPRPPPLTDDGLKGFRDVVAEAETLGEATAQAARSAREAYAAVPSDDPDLDRMGPRLEPVAC